LPDAGEFALAEAENLRDTLQVVELVLVEMTVRRGDMKKPVHHILEDLRPAGEQPRDLPGIGIVAGNVALGIVEDFGKVWKFFRGNMKDTLERFDLVRCHDAVSLRHFRAKGNHADGEGNRPLGCPRFAAGTGEPAQEIDHRAAKPAQHFYDARPNRHGGRE
jgi:hypothetical protein